MTYTEHMPEGCWNQLETVRLDSGFSSCPGCCRQAPFISNKPIYPPLSAPPGMMLQTGDPCLAPPPLQVILRCAGEELLRHYRGDLSAQVSVLLLCDGGEAARRRSLAAVSEELFRDGVNWGRIVAMMELGGALCTQAVRTGGAWQLDDITGWMEESLDSMPLRGWIHANGGWDAFVELYGEPRRPVSFWSLRTVIGLAVLGAAGITLGALFTHT
ncbi:apoptosis regulator Bcl-2-like [Sander vitreus]